MSNVYSLYEDFLFLCIDCIVSIAVTMSRPIMRTRPVDINKKLPIVKSIRELEDDDVLTSIRGYQTLRLTSEAHHEVILKLDIPEIDYPSHCLVYSVLCSSNFSLAVLVTWSWK